ncbi:MAG TPA: glycine--tRNA ligase subunit beta [Terriglobales bacterium]|nr:glycine--tRNA ligase subunit beta [Terriglobales bacterium]
MPDFLLEIGLEEVPARMIDAAQEDLARRVGEVLVRERLCPNGKLESFSTPRRLGFLARGITAAQPDMDEEVLGPSLKVSFKEGKPTQAAEAFARKVGLSVEKLEKVTTPKGEYLAAKVIKRGRPAGEVLADTLPKEIAALYWPKNMYWRAKNERFVRPLRWLVALLDENAIPMELFGMPAQAGTRGHRILGRSTTIPRAGAYEETLREVKVIASRGEREQRIRKALDAATRAVSGARWREDPELLDTVVNLTEWPSAILGNFDREFLDLPEEVLVTVMRDHQKYFAVEDAIGKLAPHFLAVLNTEGDPAGVIRHGNERVLRARFNDARFFWQTDQKRPLRERVADLKKVTFQKDLGSYYDKTMRVQKLASQICQGLEDAGVKVRPGIVHKAALLAKTDLTTELVKEFTELQGIVGGLYAREQQLDPHMNDDNRAAIATTIYDHYKPQSMEGSVPRTVEGAVLSIADKADSIVGMFALGMQPTGSKDPFALRRQANGIVKTVAEHKLPLSLQQLWTDALTGYQGSEAEKAFSAATGLDDALAGFFRERLEYYLRDVLGLEYDTVNAVLAAGLDDVVDAVARAKAVSAVRHTEDFEHIAIAFKRIKNILRQAQETGKRIAPEFNPKDLREDAELALAAEMKAIAARVEPLRAQANYAGALAEISRLRPAVDTFFDKVMVMVEDEHVRAVRLALLESLLKNFSTIADFSEIVTEGKGS